MSVHLASHSHRRVHPALDGHRAEGQPSYADVWLRQPIPQITPEQRTGLLDRLAGQPDADTLADMLLGPLAQENR